MLAQRAEGVRQAFAEIGQARAQIQNRRLPHLDTQIGRGCPHPLAPAERRHAGDSRNRGSRAGAVGPRNASAFRPAFSTESICTYRWPVKLPLALVVLLVLVLLYKSDLTVL